MGESSMDNMGAFSGTSIKVATSSQKLGYILAQTQTPKTEEWHATLLLTAGRQVGKVGVYMGTAGPGDHISSSHGTLIPKQ